jgi:hypothetical protein
MTCVTAKGCKPIKKTISQFEPTFGTLIPGFLVWLKAGLEIKKVENFTFLSLYWDCMNSGRSHCKNEIHSIHTNLIFQTIFLFFFWSEVSPYLLNFPRKEALAMQGDARCVAIGDGRHTLCCGNAAV